MSSASEDVSEPSSKGTNEIRLLRWSQKGKRYGAGISRYDQQALPKNSVDSIALKVLSMVARNEVTRVSARSNKSTWLSIILRIIAIKLRIKLHYWD